MKNRKIRFNNITTNEIFDYELPTDLLYYDADRYDEFIFDYNGESCIINKRVGYNADGTTYILEQEETKTYTLPHLELTEGDYLVSVLGYTTAYLFVRLMTKNIYTTQFATKAEVNSQISQTRDSINMVVSEKLDSKDFTSAKIMLAINNDTSSATINADKISLEGKEINLTSDNMVIKSSKFSVDKNGNITATGGTIGGFTLSDTKFTTAIEGVYEYNGHDIRLSILNYIYEVNIPTILKNLYDINNDNEIDIFDTQRIMMFYKGLMENTKKVEGTFTINTNNPKNFISVHSNNELAVSIGIGGINTHSLSTEVISCSTQSITDIESSFKGVVIDGEKGQIDCRSGRNEADTSTRITPEQINTPNVKIAQSGYVMHGKYSDYKYQCYWTGSQLEFYVDDQLVKTI